MFLKIVFTRGFITSSAGGNRFSLPVFLAQPLVEGDPLLPACKNDDFYWPPNTSGFKKRQGKYVHNCHYRASVY
jgi:hypothetical protein